MSQKRASSEKVQRDKVACSNCDKTGHHLSICKEAANHCQCEGSDSIPDSKFKPNEHSGEARG